MNAFTMISASDVKNHLHPCSNLKELISSGPLLIKAGHGISVEDENGKTYIEGMSGLWCASLGFSEPRLVRAAQRQMSSLPFNHSFRGRCHESAALLAAKLISMTPGFDKAFFASSGSEANESAVKIAWYYHASRGNGSKHKIIARRNAYHGTTIFASALTGLDVFHGGFGVPTCSVIRAELPHYAKCRAPGETEEQFCLRLVNELERQVISEDPDTIAAFIAEPIMGVGGVIPPPRGYFPKMCEMLRRYDILTIADEIVCGFGRTGKLYGSNTTNFTSDIMTVGKALSAGFAPISATLVTKEIADAIVEESAKRGMFAHGFTYSAHPTCAAVALETLNIYEEEKIVERILPSSTKLWDLLGKVGEKYQLDEVRGSGLIAAADFGERGTKRGVPFAAAVSAACLDKGLILRPLNNSIAFCPPLIVTPEEIEKIVGIFAEALESVYDAELN